MKFILTLAGLIVLAALGAYALKFYKTVQVSRKLIHSTAAFQLLSDDHSKTLLVLGDSTAFGVGATVPEESLAGLVTAKEGMTYTENRSVSGALTKDLSGQIGKASLPEYDLILIQISGNDIIRFSKPSKVADQLVAAIQELPPANKVVIIAPGDVGGSTLFPKPIGWIYTALNKKYSAEFAVRIPAAGHNAVFVNFSGTPETELIKDNPKTYLAADGLHPSSAGYALWLKGVEGAL